MVIEKLKPRITAANFDEVMCFAVAVDVSPLKMFCLKFAESDLSIKHRFENNELSPEVEFELQALWGKPFVPQSHTRKVF